MNIINDDITLRAIEKSDCDLLKKLMNSPDIERNLGGWSFPISTHNQEKWIDNFTNNSACLRLIIDVNDKSIGAIILSDIDMKNGTAQIHIKMLKDRNKGYGSKSIKLFCGYAFNELRLHLLYATVNIDNIASQRTFEKCCFKKEGILKSRVYKEGQYLDIISYSIDRCSYYEE